MRTAPNHAVRATAVNSSNVTNRPASPLRVALRYCTFDGLGSTPLGTMSLPVNVFLAALFTRTLHLPNEAIGFITALPYVCNFLQIFITPLLTRWFRAKVINVTFALLHASSWVGLLAVLSFIPRGDPAEAGRWLAIWFFISSFSASLAGVTWNTWVQEWVPARLRGKYFARRNRLLSFSSISFLLVTGWALESGAYEMWVFQAIIAVTVVLRLLGIRWIWLTPRTSLEAKAPAPMGGLWTQLDTVREAKSFLAFMAFGSVWAFAANIFGPFYFVFMFELLELSSLMVGFYTVLGTVGGALSLPAWGMLLDRYGNKGVMATSLFLWQAPGFLWCTLTLASPFWLLPAMWLWAGIVGAGFVLGMFTLMLKLVPPHAKALAIGVYVAVTSLAAAIAPIMGGGLISWGLARWAEHPFTVYHAAFAVLPILSLASIMMLLRIQEPQASRLTSVVGAMRNVRTLSGIFGLTFFTNFVFYRQRRKE
jgi:MFS family permease